MHSLLFGHRRRREQAPLALRNFESATAEVIAHAQPRIPRLTLYVLGVMIAVVLYLTWVVQLDRIVVASGRLVPIDKKNAGRELAIAPHHTGGAQDGDLVAVETHKAGRFGLPVAHVKERLGSLASERAVS